MTTIPGIRFIKGRNSNEYIGYAPKLKTTFLCSYSDKVFIEQGRYSNVSRELLESLIYFEVIDETKNTIKEVSISKEFNSYPPPIMTLLMTNSCNLACTYCYVDSKENKILSIELAKPAIDFMMQNALKNKYTKIKFRFHGVGEPTLAQDEMEEITSYILKKSNEYNLKPFFYLTTNGVISEKSLQWIKYNITETTVSCDGIPRIQDKQRPFKDGSLSSIFVENTINYFVKNNVKFKIRSTITSIGTSSISESIDYYYKLGVKNMIIEPVAIIGDITNNRLDFNIKDFYEGYISAKNLGEKLGLLVSYSGISPSYITKIHCGAYGYNFVLTPNGLISLCYEVVKPSHPLFQKMIIGLCYKDHIELFQDRFNARISELPSKCYKCFAFSNCAGGCLVRQMSKNSSEKLSLSKKCSLNRLILRYELLNALTKVKSAVPITYFS